MKWMIIGLAAVSLVIAAGSALGHECEGDRHSASGCDHTHNTGTNVTCDNPGQSCTAPCGGAGTCKNVKGGGIIPWRDCKCIQDNTISGDFVTTAGWHMVEVDPPVIMPGGVNVFIFDAASAEDFMKFLYGDGGTVIDSLPGGAFGQMTIAFDNVPPPMPGIVLDFQLTFPSYDLFGNPTGVNNWQLDPGGPNTVVFDFQHDAFYVQDVDPLQLISGNDLFAPRTAWMSFAIQEPDRAPAECWITEAEPVVVTSPAEEQSWGTIKGIYR